MLVNISCLALHLILALSAVSAATPAIVLPANGTVIAPNGTFPFVYHSISDYGTSSYNFTVWLFTSPPRYGIACCVVSRVVWYAFAERAFFLRFFVPSETFAVGYHFGRFSQPNYPGRYLRVP